MVNTTLFDDDEQQQPKKSPAEWQSYVDGLSMEELADVTEHANSAAFVHAMSEEGYDADEIHAVLLMFARRFQSLGQVPPPGYVDLEWLAQNP